VPQRSQRRVPAGEPGRRVELLGCIADHRERAPARDGAADQRALERRQLLRLVDHNVIEWARPGAARAPRLLAEPGIDRLHFRAHSERAEGAPHAAARADPRDQHQHGAPRALANVRRHAVQRGCRLAGARC